MERLDTKLGRNLAQPCWTSATSEQIWPEAAKLCYWVKHGCFGGKRRCSGQARHNSRPRARSHDARLGRGAAGILCYVCSTSVPARVAMQSLPDRPLPPSISRYRIGQFRPTSAWHRPNSTRLRPSSTEIGPGPTSPKLQGWLGIGPALPEVGRIWPHVDKIRPKLAGIDQRRLNIGQLDFDSD